MSLYHQDSMLAKDYREEMVRAVERNRISAGRGAGLWGVILHSSRVGSGRKRRG